MRYLIGLVCSFALLTANVATGEAREVWKITSLDWQPYSGSNMSSQGNSIQKLRELLKDEGIELLVEFYPWARAQKLASAEGYVGYFPAWPEEVGKGFFASPPIDWSQVAVMTYRGSGFQWKGLDALFKEPIGLVGSYVYPDNITQAMKKNPHNIDSAPQERSLLRKLVNKRFKTAITDPSVMLFIAESEGIDSIEVAKVIAEKELVIAFREGPENRKRKALLEKILSK